MKVTGPKAGTPGTEPEAVKSPEAPGPKAVGPEAPNNKTFAQTLAAGRAGPAPAPGAVRGAETLTAHIAADLKAGKLGPEAALDRVVELVLDQQLGANAPVALRDKLRDALRDTISSDPFLTERLRGLG
jgi:hypothetical protein